MSDLWKLSDARAVLLLLGALVACKGSDERARKPQAAPSASGSKPTRGGVSTLATSLAQMLRQPADYTTSKDNSDTKTITFFLRPIAGIELTSLVRVRDEPEAWRFGLEGMPCARVDELGLEVSQLSRGWYRVQGGPLDQTLVKVSPGKGEGICNIMPGTAQYWEHQGEKPGD